MFSATLHSQEVKDAAAKICQQPIVVDLKVRGVVKSTLRDLRDYTCPCVHSEKNHMSVPVSCWADRKQQAYEYNRRQ